MKAFKRAISLGLKSLIACAGIFICNSATSIAGSPKVPFEKERMDIQRDLANIYADQSTIDFLKSRCKANKKAGQYEALVINEKSLAKAKADLKRDKAYLLADKKDLKREHREAVANCKSFVREDRANLSDARWERFKNRYMKGDETAAAKNELAVAKYKAELKKHKDGLENEKVFYNTDMIAINRKIDRADGQFAAITTTEIAYAKTENWVMGR